MRRKYKKQPCDLIEAPAHRLLLATFARKAGNDHCIRLCGGVPPSGPIPTAQGRRLALDHPGGATHNPFGWGGAGGGRGKWNLLQASPFTARRARLGFPIGRSFLETCRIDAEGLVDSRRATCRADRPPPGRATPTSTPIQSGRLKCWWITPIPYDYLQRSNGHSLTLTICVIHPERALEKRSSGGHAK